MSFKMDVKFRPLFDYLSRGHQYVRMQDIDAINTVWDRAREEYKGENYAPNPPRSLRIEELTGKDRDFANVYLPLAYLEFAQLASKLLGHRKETISTRSLDLMLHAHTKPLRAGIDIRTPVETKKNRVFLKVFDPTRLFGLEIYRLLGAIGRDYHFITDDNVTLEEGIHGCHEFEISPESRRKINSEVYLSQRIALDSFRVNLGLGDLSKQDNYIVSPEGFITIIDFDIMSSNMQKEEIEALKKDSARKLGISRADYDSIFEEQTKLFRLNYAMKKEQVDELIRAYSIIDEISGSEAHHIIRFLNRPKSAKVVRRAK